MKKTSFVWSLTGVAAVLGFMLSVQLSTHVAAAKNSDVPQSYMDLINEISVQSDQNNLVDQQIAQVNAQLDKFKSAGPSSKEQQQALKQDANQVDQAAGLTAVSGPGITISLQQDGPLSNNYDPQIDLSFIVNILFSDGADAISINDQRLTTISTIRDIDGGSFVEVNGQPTPEPYAIVAEGNVKNMLSILDVEQIASEMQQLGMKCTISQSTSVNVPAYTGALPGQYAKEVTGQ